jgi:hypothetical protein
MVRAPREANMNANPKPLACAVLLALASVPGSVLAQDARAADLTQLRELIKLQQQQLESQARALESLRTQVESIAAAGSGGRPVDAKRQSGVVASGNDKVKLSLSGQVNRGVLVADDGEETDVFHVDNDNSSTRLLFVGEASPDATWTVGTQIEVQMESNSTADINQLNPSTGGTSFTERKLEGYVRHQQYGTLWFGQGDTASNGTSEVDLSGTGVVGYSGIGDMAGGLLFRDGGGALTAIRIKDVFSNFDGLSRDDRLRYDTPGFGGLKFSASTAANEKWDVAARYAADHGTFKATAALAYADPHASSFDNQVNGSLSLLHDSGWNATLAVGERDHATRDPQFWYAKFGYQATFWPVGKSAFAIDYTETEDVAAVGDTFESYAALFVQSFDKYGTELYSGVRNHSLDRPGLATDDILALLIGARIKF